MNPYATSNLARYQAGRTEPFNPRNTRVPLLRAIAELGAEPHQVVGVVNELARLRRRGAPLTMEVVERVTREVMVQDDLRGGPSNRMHAPVVYYIRFGSRIKIGTSTNLAARLTALPHDEVLAIEPGNARVEKRRHATFADSRVRGEWFEETPALLEWISSLPPFDHMAHR